MCSERYDNARIYALCLLTHFEEPLAHEVIIKLFSLPENMPGDLFGDCLCEQHVPTIFYRTRGDSFDSIKTLITNSKADLYSRIYAMESIVFGVGEERLPRQDAVEFFGQLLSRRNRHEHKDYWSNLVWSIHHIYPKELMEEAKRAFDEGYIDTTNVEFKFLEESLRKRTVEISLDIIRNQLYSRTPPDVHGYFSWWKDAFGADSAQVGRNDVCPCGSGKKYKKCCLT